MVKRDFIKDVLLGVATGDTIGVPVEFKPRKWLRDNPVTGIQGYGSHNQPPGTWSDDSSLTFCLAEMLCGKFDMKNLGNRFINWKRHAYWTPHAEVFDIGIATSAAIDRLENDVTPVLAGGDGENSNGNGSLMRILPLVFYNKGLNIDKRFLAVKDVSSLTHRHIRSVLACFIYLELALELLAGRSAREAYQETCTTVNTFLNETDTCTAAESGLFSRVLGGDIGKVWEDEIHSSGYVLHTLEAGIWCLLNTNNYADAVLKAANLGEDTDTTAAVTGGLAGLLYGWMTIPEEWLASLVRREDIENLGKRLNAKLSA